MTWAQQAVLITGGTGTIGQALTRRLVEAGTIRHLRVFSRSEALQQVMRQQFPGVEYCLGDIRDALSVQAACRGIDLVVHAAALKHVDRGESEPSEFIQTNVWGTRNLLLGATAQGVRRVLLLSTDKAVAPINAYGATKMLAERLCLRAAAQGLVPCTVVRYGNVLGSRGSVLDVWRGAQARGQPLPLTDPNMTRFHLEVHTALHTIDAALQILPHSLIVVPHLQAFTVAHLAAALLGLDDPALLQEGTHIDTIGRRVGERPYELLMSPEECATALVQPVLPPLDRLYCIVTTPGMQAPPGFQTYHSASWPDRASVHTLREAIHACSPISCDRYCRSEWQP